MNVNFMRGLIAIGLTCSTFNLAFAATPSARILWDISKGYTWREDPLAFGSEDGFADVLLTYSAELRALFPGDRPVSPGGPIFVAPDTTSYKNFISQGTFPDIVLTDSKFTSTPQAYINLSQKGLQSERLSDYSAIVLPIDTAAYQFYTRDEAALIKDYVASGGRLILVSDNFWTPRATLMPIFSIFGVSPTMQLVMNTSQFSSNEQNGLFAGVGVIHTRAGAGLCIGTSVGWQLTPEEVARIEQFGNGQYEAYLSRFRAEYALLPGSEHCKERTPPPGVQVEYIAQAEIVNEGSGLTEWVPVIARAKLGLGQALIFSDASWYDNSMRDYARSSGMQNEEFIKNVLKFMARKD